MILGKLDSCMLKKGIRAYPYTVFSRAPKSLQLVSTALKLKTLALWKKSCDKPREHIKKQRRYFADKGLYSQSYGFFQ